MCGISGIIPLSSEVTKEVSLSIMQFLLTENEHRGKDATGIASMNIIDKKVLVCKQAETAKEFITHLTVDHIWGPVIGHNRAKTRGEPEDPENNHPMYGSKYCMVHNGMVHSMKELPEYKLKGKCDTEVLLSYFETRGIKAAIPEIDGSAAVAILSPLERMLYIYKHTNPVYIAHFPGKAIVFSSTEAPLKKIGTMLKMEKVYGLFNNYQLVDVDEGQLITFNLETNELALDMIKIDYKNGIWYNSK
jgi:glucosamine 6-phosphate synthetase-like amidotransferase/phosphosugar isomerase protein